MIKYNLMLLSVALTFAASSSTHAQSITTGDSEITQRISDAVTPQAIPGFLDRFHLTELPGLTPLLYLNSPKM